MAYLQIQVIISASIDPCMNTKLRRSWIVLIGLCLFLSVHCIAQKKDKKKKNKNEEPIFNIPLDTLLPADQEIFYFPNMNILPYYYDEAKLEELAKYDKKGQTEYLYLGLLEYVSNFGIENFYKNTFLLWKLGKMASEQGNHEQALSLYRYVLKHHPEGNINEVRLYYDSLTQNDKDYYIPVQDYYELVQGRKEVDENYANLGMHARPLSKEVNDSIVNDYAPTITKDGQRTIVVFTSRRSYENMSLRAVNKSDDKLYTNEDLFLTTKLDTFYVIKTESGTEIDTVPWTRAEPLEGLNTEHNEGSACISMGGKEIYFSRCDSPDGFGNCDLFRAIWNEEKNSWDNVQNLGLLVNSINWDSHPSLSHTGDTLFFASNRIGGFGMEDIYFTYKIRSPEGNFEDDQGTFDWAKAQNLGPTINTRYREVSPFYHPFHHVIYFSSSGQLVNQGDLRRDGRSSHTFDIFISRHSFKTIKHGKELKKVSYWSEPKNTGPFINHKGDEYYFAIDAEEYIYFSKSDTTTLRVNDKQSYPIHDLKGKLVGNEQYIPDKHDIIKYIDDSTREVKRVVMNLYSFPLPMEAQPTATTVLKGTVDGQGIVQIIDLDNNIEVYPKFTRPDGGFEFELIKNNRYLLVFSGEDFFRIEKEFLLKGDTVINLEAEPIKFKTWRFESIRFDEGEHNIDDAMKPDLDKLVTLLIDNPQLGLNISGHTDGQGDEQKNLNLSTRRAESIKQYIIDKGKFTDNRIKAVGFGSSKPIVKDEKTDEDRLINRRVEFEFFKL